MKLKETEKAEIVIKAVIKYYRTDESTIFEKNRKRKIAQMRQMCQYLLTKHTNLSYLEVAHKTNITNHATIIHACKSISNLIETDNSINEDFLRLNTIIESHMVKYLNKLSELDVKKLDAITVIQSASSELEMEQRLIDHFNLNQDLTKMKHLKGALTRAQKKLEKEMHPTIQRVLDLPKNKLDDLIKYKIEPHLKMNA